MNDRLDKVGLAEKLKAIAAAVAVSSAFSTDAYAKGDNCNDSCTASCGTGCEYNCSGFCFDACARACGGNCKSGCKGKCKGGCDDDGCTTSCNAGCNGCSGKCKSDCSTSCGSNGCTTDCNAGCNGCVGACKSDCSTSCGSNGCSTDCNAGCNGCTGTCKSDCSSSCGRDGCTGCTGCRGCGGACSYSCTYSCEGTALGNYTITLSSGDGVYTRGTEKVVNQSIGSAMQTITPPTKKGYAFGGYFKERDGEGDQYYNDQGRSVQAWKDTNGRGSRQSTSTAVDTLYAKWTKNNYAVNINLNGGSFEDGGGVRSGESVDNLKRKGYRVAKYSGRYDLDSSDIDITDPVRNGYAFAGWDETVGDPGDKVGAAQPKTRRSPKGYTRF